VTHDGFVFADPDGVTASNFGGTTIGPGAYGIIRSVLHFIECPRSWTVLEEQSVLDMLPVTKAGEPDEECPAYFFTARHGQSTGILVASSVWHLGQAGFNDDSYKMFIQHYCTPIDRVIEEAKKDWEMYEKKIRDQGQVPADAPYIPYPYTEEYLWQQLEHHKQTRILGDANNDVAYWPADRAETLQFSEVTLLCASTNESISVKTRYGHTIAELQLMLSKRYGVQDPQAMEFFDSQGGQHSKPMDPQACVVPHMTVRGISMFKQLK